MARTERRSPPPRAQARAGRLRASWGTKGKEGREEEIQFLAVLLTLSFLPSLSPRTFEDKERSPFSLQRSRHFNSLDRSPNRSPRRTSLTNGACKTDRSVQYITRNRLLSDRASWNDDDATSSSPLAPLQLHPFEICVCAHNVKISRAAAASCGSQQPPSSAFS